MESSRTQWRVRLAEGRSTWPFEQLLRPGLLRFVRFAIVGGSGVLLNMLALWLLHDQWGFPLTRSAMVAISLAILNNFVWNNFWTFGATGIQARKLGQFIVVSLIGMVINLVVLNILHALGVHYAIANLIGIIVATAWNFLANSRWTWSSTIMAPAPTRSKRGH